MEIGLQELTIKEENWNEDLQQQPLHYRDGVFSVEASSLGCVAAQVPFVQLFVDDDSVGLAIRSERTGSVAEYRLAETHRDREGDVTHWSLVPTRETERTNPGSLGTKVVVFND